MQRNAEKTLIFCVIYAFFVQKNDGNICKKCYN